MKLDGKPIDVLSLKSDRESLLRFLDSSAADELFSKSELEKRGYTRSQLEKWVAVSEHYSCKVGQTRFWGNPKALKELDKQLKAVR